MSRFVTVARVADIPSGTPKQVFIDGEPIAVCNVAGEFFAISDICTHERFYLSNGQMQGDEIECPRHGGAFNIRTGEAEVFPAEKPLRTFACRVVDGEIQLEV